MTSPAAQQTEISPTGMLKAGRSVIPCNGNKKPQLKWGEFQKRKPTPAELQEWQKNSPPIWAMVTGAISNVITLDFDGESGRQTLKKLGLKPHRRSLSGGYHVDFEHPGWPVTTVNGKSKRKLGQQYPGVDIRGDGGYVCILGGSKGRHYKWLRDPKPDSPKILPKDLRRALGLLPPAPVVQIDDWKAEATALLAKWETQARANGNRNGNIRDADWFVRKALNQATAEGRNNAGFWLACQLRDAGYGQPEAERIMIEYVSRTGTTNTKGQPEPYTQADALASLKQACSRQAREPLRRVTTSDSGTAKGTAVDLLSQTFTDHGNSRRLIDLYGKDLRYCHEFRKWLAWDGRRWAVDTDECSRRWAHATVLEFGRQAFDADNKQAVKFAGTSLGSQRITNMLREAQPDLPIGSAQLDTHPDLLNFTNGTLDLRTGKLEPHQPEHYITKMLQYAYRPDAECPRFLKFMAQVSGKHAALVPYIQRALGYSLTGHTIEKSVFLLHGQGDNGKSTLLVLFLRLLGEYAVLLQIDTLMTRQESSNTQADLADLRGARFVMTSETEEGQRLATGKLKRITQGMGKIKATRKYENPIEFPETHKLWIDANHLPLVRETDNAIWNRLCPVPFRHRFLKKDQDPELPAKLIAEAEGVLAWAVRGCAEWYANSQKRIGLGKPLDVERAAKRWRVDSDPVGRFIADRCAKEGAHETQASTLYSEYKDWCEDEGEKFVMTNTAFGKRMVQEDDVHRFRTKTGAKYRGIALKSSLPSPEWST